MVLRADDDSANDVFPSAGNDIGDGGSGEKKGDGGTLVYKSQEVQLPATRTIAQQMHTAMNGNGHADTDFTVHQAGIADDHGLSTPLVEDLDRTPHGRMFMEWLLNQKRFMMVSKVGAGGQGTTYKLRDTRDGTFGVMKIGAGNFGEEARHCDTLAGDGVSVEWVKDMSGEVGCAALYMEFIDGDTLDFLGKSHDQTLGDITEVTAIVAKAHARGIVHGDLKPSNIIKRRDGKGMRIVDFGIGKSQGNRLQEQNEDGIRAGSLKYMPPEQWNADNFKVTRKADVYAVGVMLLEELTGGEIPLEKMPAGVSKLEFFEQERKRVQAEIRRLRSSLNGNVPSELLQLINAMLAEEQGERPTMEQAHEKLVALSKEPVSALRKYVRGAIFAVTGMLALGLAAGGVMAFKRSSGDPKNSPDTALKSSGEDSQTNGKEKKVEESKIEKQKFGDFEHTLENGEIKTITFFPGTPNEISLDREECVLMTREKDGKLVFATAFLSKEKLLKVLGLSSATELPRLCQFGTRLTYFPGGYVRLERLGSFFHVPALPLAPLVGGGAAIIQPIKRSYFAENLDCMQGLVKKGYPRSDKPHTDPLIQHFVLSIYEGMVQSGVKIDWGDFDVVRVDYTRDKDGNIINAFPIGTHRMKTFIVQSGIRVRNGTQHGVDIKKTPLAVDVNFGVSATDDASRIRLFIEMLNAMNPKIGNDVRKESQAKVQSPGRDALNAASPGKP